MCRSTLIVVAGICLGVQSNRSPGDGCCGLQAIQDGYSIDVASPAHAEEYQRKYPGFQIYACTGEKKGKMARTANGDQLVDMSARCMYGNPDAWDREKVMEIRELVLKLANGTQIQSDIATYPNGTTAGSCRNIVSRRPTFPAPTDPTMCLGMYQKYLGIISYGSLQVERYASSWWSESDLNDDFTDLDVEHGCIPLQLGRGIQARNFIHSDPAEALFAIPKDCLKPPSGANDPYTRVWGTGLESSLNSDLESSLSLFFPSFDKANRSSSPALRGGVSRSNVKPHH